MTKHVHAEMMASTLRMRCRLLNLWLVGDVQRGVRWDFASGVRWAPNRQYRRKARTITIEGVTLRARD